MSERRLRVCALYPDLMNIYADRGNLRLLEQRCRWRGIGFDLIPCGIGDRLDPDAADLYYMGGGQDRDQKLCAGDLYDTKRDQLAAAAARGAVVFGVCGGYQLLGHSYELGGIVYSSQPTAVRVDGPGFVLERRRETIDGAGGRRVEQDVLRIDRLSAIELEREAGEVGLHPAGRIEIPPTADHVGSVVVMLRG